MTFEDFTKGIDKLDILFDHIADQTDDKEAGIICTKLGLDNPHISQKRSVEEYKRLADKMIMCRRIIKGTE